MIASIHRSNTSKKTRRHVLTVFVALVCFAGCGQPSAPVAIPFTVPDEFSDKSGTWVRSESEPSKSDNQKIGKFFEKHADLIGSPDWTGQPEKYLCEESKSTSRFYWFSGNKENPSWNALEFSGSKSRQLSGVGSPGA